MDSYQHTARRYDRYVNPLLAGLRRIGYGLHRPRKGMRVLDVGCGTGTILRMYRDAGCRVSGIDLSPAMVVAARQKLGPRAGICMGDGGQLPYPDNCFDLVSGWLTLHEMSPALRPAVLGEMVRVTKDTGRILIVDYRPGRPCSIFGWLSRVPILFFEIMAGPDHFRHYRDFMGRGGLTPLLSQLPLTVKREKTAVGGNIGLIVLRPKASH
jgi:ubiquinone/menaquinone biosynthesis C-methylase UbiE